MYIVYLKPGKEESLKRFHPWVFSGAIARIEGEPEEGEVVDVYTSRKEFVARGHYQVGSIAVRVLTFRQEEPVDGVDMVARSAFFRVMRKRGLAVVSGGWGLAHFLGDAVLPGDRYTSLVPSEVLSADFRQLARKPRYRRLFDSENSHLKFCDLCYERIPHLLRCVDKMSMYYGVQIRNAFLNHNLIEIAFALAGDSSSGRARRQWFDHEVVTPLLSGEVRLAPESEAEEPMLPAEMKRWADEVVLDLRYGRVSEWFDHTRLERAWRHEEDELFADPAKVWKLLSLYLQLKSLG